jgi:hypothetical protein
MRRQAVLEFWFKEAGPKHWFVKGQIGTITPSRQNLPTPAPPPAKLGSYTRCEAPA